MTKVIVFASVWLMAGGALAEKIDVNASSHFRALSGLPDR
jgi:hypothetical protein